MSRAIISFLALESFLAESRKDRIEPPRPCEDLAEAHTAKQFARTAQIHSLKSHLLRFH